jgi:hypothetical protein
VIVECGVGGGINSVISTIALYPLDTIKTWIQAGGKHMSWKVRVKEALKFKGMSCVLLGSFPGNITFFTTYEFINSTISNYSNYSENK